MAHPTAAQYLRNRVSEIFERHSNGEHLNDICRSLRVKPATFRALMRSDAKLKQEWTIVRDEYTHSIFNQMLSLSHELATRKFTRDEAPEVNAKRAALDGFKHTTARLNPQAYGEQKNQQQGVTVYINTSLPLGEDDEPATVVDGDFKITVTSDDDKGTKH